MIVFDFFAGTRSSTAAFEDAGHTVISFELDPQFRVTETVDILTLSAEDLIARYGKPDFVWASPPCTTFSVASIGPHWARGGGQSRSQNRRSSDWSATRTAHIGFDSGSESAVRLDCRKSSRNAT